MKQRPEDMAGVEAFIGAVGGAGRFTRKANCFRETIAREHRHWRESHDRAIAGGIRRSRTCERLTGGLESTQRSAHRDTDVEAASIRREMTVSPPAAVAFHLVPWIEAAAFNQTLGEAKCH